MKQLSVFRKWVRSWVTLPQKAREYREFLMEHGEARVRFNEWAAHFGYLGYDHMDAAIEIACRCEGAEVALKRLAEGIEREPDWKREYDREVAHGKETERLFEEVLAERRALENGQTVSGLSPAEVERLALLSMYAGKLAAETAKVVLYGWGSPSPCTGRPSYVDVERGLGRLQAIAELMAEAGDVRGGDVRAHGTRAKERICEQVTRQ